jgi:hypothetical protein
LLISDSEIYIGDIIVMKQITDDDNIIGRPKYIQNATKLAMENVMIVFNIILAAFLHYIMCLLRLVKISEVAKGSLEAL